MCPNEPSLFVDPQGGNVFPSVVALVNETAGTLRFAWTGPADAGLPSMLRQDLLDFDREIALEEGSEERHGSSRRFLLQLRWVGSDLSRGVPRLHALAKRMRWFASRTIRASQFLT